MGEEEVHGSVEVRVQPRHQNDGGVAHKGQEICNQDNHEEDSLQMGLIRKSQKDEISLGSFIGYIHLYCNSAKLEKKKNHVQPLTVLYAYHANKI